MEWQPIETAPRDGTWILGANCNGKGAVFKMRSEPLPGDGRVWAANAGWRAQYALWPCYPTHWMPLPEPPK